MSPLEGGKSQHSNVKMICLLYESQGGPAPVCVSWNGRTEKDQGTMELMDLGFLCNLGFTLISMISCPWPSVTKSNLSS